MLGTVHNSVAIFSHHSIYPSILWNTKWGKQYPDSQVEQSYTWVLATCGQTQKPMSYWPLTRDRGPDLLEGDN